MAISPIDLRDVALGVGGYVLRGQDGGDLAGTSIAGIGDINGDGFEDFAIGAPFAYAEALGLPDNGETFVVFGNGTRPTGAIQLSSIASGTGGFVVRGAGSSDQSGMSVAGAGDMNGDGIADFVIGAGPADGIADLRISSGEAYVIFGKTTPFGAAIDLSGVVAGTGGFAVLGRSSGDLLGGSVTSVGDVNGDGLADIMIGASLADGLYETLPDGGNAFVVYGRAGTDGTPIDLAALTPAQGFAIGAADASDRAAFSVSGAGDINGDGIADMVIGAVYADVGDVSNAGRSFVVFGGASGNIELAQIAAGTGGFAIDGIFEDDLAGRSLSATGDFNGDGLADILIGAPYGEGPGGTRLNAGDAFLVFGSATPPANVALGSLGAGSGYVFHGEEALDVAGFSVAFAGDLNGDGYDDIAIAARNGGGAGNGRPQSGDIYVVFGKPGAGGTIDLATIAAGTGGFVIRGEDAYENASIVAAAGDVDGDGYDDLLIGVPRGDGAANSRPNAGDAYIVYGRDFTGTVTHLGDDTANSLDGDFSADTMVGGQGGDVFFGNGGADAMHGGEGDDQFSVTDGTFRRIDGGTGFDSFLFDAMGEALSLADAAGSRLRSIEQVHIYGTGANTLSVTARAVLNMSEASNLLLVEGGGDDSVVLQDSGWSLGTGPAGYATYVNGLARLQVSQFIGSVVACFASGTRIATHRGEVHVEELREGDIALLADGTRRAVRWIGHRATTLTRHPRPWDVQPVCVQAGAFGPGLPRRDLRLSPDHAVFAGGVLVPVRHLLNGASITQEAVPRVTYWHVELAGPDGSACHGVILAEGLPVESYLDTGNRAAFANGGAPMDLHPDFARAIWDAQGCAPLVTGGPALAELRATLLAHAEVLGHVPAEDAGAHLIVDGRRLDADWQDGATLGFVLPAGAREVRLASRMAAPAWLDPASDDHRLLGLAVAGLAIDGIALDLHDPRLAAGWHAPEPGWRWTAGCAPLPAADACLVELRLMPFGRFWRERPSWRARVA